jgi:hypothetical protein
MIADIETGMSRRPLSPDALAEAVRDSLASGDRYLPFRRTQPGQLWARLAEVRR